MTVLGAYRLRPAELEDFDLIEFWMRQDPYHKGMVHPEFFCMNEEGAECFAVEDRDRVVVFYVKMTREGKALRLNMQFGPESSAAQKMQNAEALNRGFEWLRTAALGAGLEEIRFRTYNPRLMRYAKRRLGFLEAPDGLFYRVRPLTPSEAEKIRCNGSNITQDEGDSHVREQ